MESVATHFDEGYKPGRASHQIRVYALRFLTLGIIVTIVLKSLQHFEMLQGNISNAPMSFHPTLCHHDFKIGEKRFVDG
jgi:hypothetical protein